MGTILASTIITKAATQLQDADYERWELPELLGWVSEAERAICIALPKAFVKTAVMVLAVGTRQALPADGLVLMDMPRNMGTDGSTPGRAVRMARRDELDARAPNWHAARADAVVRHFIPIEADPKAFFVYPPNTGAGRAELIYGATPPELTAASQAIHLDDIYETPLLDYVLYRAFSKDTEVADETKASRHFQAFAAAVGGKPRAEAVAKASQSAPAGGAKR